ncbi:hypothetical protein CEUSTIGMA_g6224.t1 [Chlamydomonas eustigma]|uniref:Uncharacterized protein n=1 Tax=Chlamydomonas eustigma TaxID=1157962 RepID=A0A250X6U1_9CHLO|nr:hypothetical protein CEUSTIGMA_g6224.t1 [Chlamydomonas eustigma]|eukprot:GAX78787.1 hypothetical protein CEUSTIGMA_g6224.t1 [Chlamydomonas eustigma]
MVSNQPYKTGPLDRIERAHGSARVDQTASVVSTSQGVPNSPPPPSQRTRDDPSPLLFPLATTFHPSSPQGISAVDSALVGITQRTQRGSSKKSKPSLAGDLSDLSSSTSAAHSVKSGDSSHYRTPITTNTTNTIPPIPSVVGPSAGLNQSGGFDPDNSELAAAAISQGIAQSTESITQIVTQNVTQALTAYFDKRMQAQEFAAQASQAALEKKLLEKVEKVERIEDDQAFFRASSSGYQSSITFEPIPSLHRAVPQPAGNSHQQAVPPVAPSRERNLPRISEVDHGGYIPFNMGIHAGARRVPLTQLPLGPPSAPPASEYLEYHSPPSHPSEGASHHHSHSRAPPPAHVPTFIPTDHRRAVPVSSASHGPAHSTGYVPSTSTSNIPYDEDQTFKLNSLDAKSVPTFKPKKGLITYYKYSHTLNNLLATQGPRFDNCHAYLEGVREFVERVLQVYDLFNMADPLMFSQELDRYPTLHVFKAGLPEDYSPHITKILQELGVRTMDRDQQLMHIITKLQNYHEFVISVKHDNSRVTSTPGKSVHSGGAAHHTPSSPQAQETGCTRPLRRAFPAAHVSMLDENVHDVPVHDSEYAYDTGYTGTSHPQNFADNDEQERVPSLQEELVELHTHATFPSTMHPRGNPRPPLPPSAANSYQQRPPGSTRTPGPASTTSTSRPT